MTEREAKFYTTRFGKRSGEEGPAPLSAEVPDAIGEILSVETNDAMAVPLGRPPSIQSRSIEGILVLLHRFFE